MKLNMDPQMLISQATGKLSTPENQKNLKAKQETLQQFEAIFVQEIFKGMRATIPEGGLLPKNNANSIYTQLQDMEAAKQLTAEGGIGLADMLYQQLNIKPEDE